MMRRGRWAVLGTIGLVAAVLGVYVASAETAPTKEEEKPTYKYIGVSSCAKLCHKTTKQGKQLSKWQSLRHSKAFETLKTDKAKEVAKQKGLKKAAHEAPECLKCHATGWNLPKEQLKSRFKIEDGVQCETCHGPGEKYKPKAIMNDREKALALGLVVADEKMCRGCHNDTAPSWDPERYTIKDGKKVGFDFEQAWKKIAHMRPKKED